jgi:hypothetical protein
MVFVDFDRVESKNVHAQAYTRQSVGRYKADALRLQLLNYHGTQSEAFPVRLDGSNVDTLVDGADLLIDCFDNAESREVLSATARQRQIPLVHAAISADGTFGLVRWDERFRADAEDEPDQATCEAGEHLPFIALVSSGLAATIRDFVATGARYDLAVTLRDMTVTVTTDESALATEHASR